MAYASNKKGTELDSLTSLDDGDVVIVSDLDDSGRAKKITKANVAATFKATGAEVDTGTEDAKFATPKALADAGMYHTGSTDVAIADGGTGASTATAAFNNLSPTTTKGDIIVDDGSNDVRLAVGTNGQVLTANSAQTEGVEWSNLTKIAISTADVTVNNSTTETTVITQTISGGDLGTNNAAKFRVFITDLGIEESLTPEATLTVRLKYGATTLASTTITSETAQLGLDGSGFIDGMLAASGATNTQKGFISILASGDVPDADTNRTTFTASSGTAAEDSTGDLTLAVTVQWNATDANNQFTSGGYEVQIIR